MIQERFFEIKNINRTGAPALIRTVFVLPQRALYRNLPRKINNCDADITDNTTRQQHWAARLPGMAYSCSFEALRGIVIERDSNLGLQALVP